MNPSALADPLQNSSLSDAFCVSMGWKPDAPDIRDKTLSNAPGKKLVTGETYKEKIDPVQSFIPEKDFCPIQNQGHLESCTAHAVVALLEYLRWKGAGNFDELSRMFLYNITREYMGLVGDTGATIRDTIKTAALFGVPPEKNFPYIPGNLSAEPAAFLFAFAGNFKALNYTRLDDVHSPTPADVIRNVKRAITCDLPVAFGFTVYTNISTAADIPMPAAQDTPQGGHALLITGYDDKHKIVGEDGKPAVVPSFRIRNSWGTGWGEQGYGWLPYDYVEQQLACDFWTCLAAAHTP